MNNVLICVKTHAVRLRTWILRQPKSTHHLVSRPRAAVLCSVRSGWSTQTMSVSSSLTLTFHREASFRCRPNFVYRVSSDVLFQINEFLVFLYWFFSGPFWPATFFICTSNFQVHILIVLMWWYLSYIGNKFPSQFGMFCLLHFLNDILLLHTLQRFNPNCTLVLITCVSFVCIVTFLVRFIGDSFIVHLGVIYFIEMMWLYWFNTEPCIVNFIAYM